ncbi:MAG: hypothetical protein ACO3NK_04070 [Prochlorotrichaceae cyanobacterium]
MHNAELNFGLSRQNDRFRQWGEHHQPHQTPGGIRSLNGEGMSRD